MGSCVSSKRSSDAQASAMKMGLAIPPSPVKEKESRNPIQSPSVLKDFGSKEDAFFDSQAWIDSDCEDDFYSVNGDFTPSRGSTPVHHGFSRGSTPVHKALGDRTPIRIPEPSPTTTKKKLLQLFDEDKEDADEQEQHTSGGGAQHAANGKQDVSSTILNLPPKSANGTPFVSGPNSVCGSERTANGDEPLQKEKSVRASPCCIPSLLSCRSLTDRKKKVNHAIAV